MSEQGSSKRQCAILKRQRNAHTIKPLQGEKNELDEGRAAPRLFWCTHHGGIRHVMVFC